MKNIITLTVNPAIDKSTTVAGLKPNSKLRCTSPVFEAGGGGINVSHVLKELGGSSLCMYMAGGATGNHLKDILIELDISQKVIPIKGWTRENLAVTDTVQNHQYRFGMPGPELSEAECQEVLQELELLLEEGDFLVASGSLSPGMPIDFYAKVGLIAQKKGAKYVLDTSGEALVKGAMAGVYMLKPNLGELSTLCGVQTMSFRDLDASAKVFMDHTPCEILVVSLGAQGALMVTKDEVAYITAPIVYQQSTIGAGDSMVAGMIFRLAMGGSHMEMAQFGVACGTAATMSAGTQLCKMDDIEPLYQWIQKNTDKSSRIRF